MRALIVGLILVSCSLSGCLEVPLTDCPDDDCFPLSSESLNAFLSLSNSFNVLKLADEPRDSAKIRIRNRCEVSGRPRGYDRKLRMSRIALRDLASMGQVPGVVKSSW